MVLIHECVMKINSKFPTKLTAILWMQNLKMYSKKQDTEHNIRISLQQANKIMLCGSTFKSLGV
jgi:hypothetical protein